MCSRVISKLIEGIARMFLRVKADIDLSERSLFLPN